MRLPLGCAFLLFAALTHHLPRRCLQYMPSRSSSTSAAPAAPTAAPQPAARPPPPQPLPLAPLPPAPLPQPQPHVPAAEPPPFQPEDWLPNWDQGTGQAADWAEGYGDYWQSDGEGEGGEADWHPVEVASSRPLGSRGAGGSSSQYAAAPVLSDVRLFIRNLDPDATQAALTRTFAK